MQEHDTDGDSDRAGDRQTRTDGGTRRGATAVADRSSSLLPSGVVSGEKRAGEPPAERCMSKDEVFEMLQNERRRRILRYLLEADDVITIGELAERIAAVENDTSVAALNSTQRKRVYVALYQTHLPKMDDVGVIDYDRDRGRVQIAENADLLTFYLDEEFDDDDPWHRRYLLLSVLGGALVVVGHLLGGAAGPALGLLVVALFLSVSVAHGYSYWRDRTGTEATRRRIE